MGPSTMTERVVNSVRSAEADVPDGDHAVDLLRVALLAWNNGQYWQRAERSDIARFRPALGTRHVHRIIEVTRG